MSSSRSSLDPALVEAMVAAVRERLPAGTPLTLDALEDAVLGVFKDVGPAAAQRVAASHVEPQKRGLRRCAAVSPPAGSAGEGEGSSPASGK